MNNYEIVRDAIRHKRIVTATYAGHRRVMCPHVIGISKKGREQALFYQFGGSSSSGLAPAGSGENWRCIPVANLQDVKASDGDWHTGPNHSRPQRCVAEVDLQVDY